MLTKTKLLRNAVLVACSIQTAPSLAALADNSTLLFSPGVVSCVIGSDPNTATGCQYDVTDVTEGSFFGMDTSGNGTFEGNEKTTITANNNLTLGIIQAASGSHAGSPDNSESPGIDQPWVYAGNTGMHGTTSPITIISDDGAGTVVLDMSGWSVDWNGNDNIPMGACQFGDSSLWGGFSTCDQDKDGVDDKINTGEGTLKCYSDNTFSTLTDCVDGVFFTLDHTTNVPYGDPSGFGGFFYGVHLEGTLSIPNVPPTAATDTLLVNAGGTATIDVTSNGSDDPDGNNANLTVGTIVAGNKGNVSSSGAIITYTHTASDTAQDSFTYTVSDGTDESAPATVTVNINAIPVAVNDGASALPNGSVDIDILSNDTDADGNNTIDPASVIITNPASGNNTTNGSISVNTTTGVVTYTNNGTTGQDSFSYTVADDNGAVSNEATVTIDVQADPAPTCNDANISLDQDTTIDFAVTNNSTAGGSKTLDPTSVTTPTLPTNGSVTINTSTGDITYAPSQGFIGSDSFTYTIDDDTKTCTPATVSIEVLSTNTPPTTGDDTATTSVNTAVSIDVTANDSDNAGVANSTITIASQPSNGSVSIASGTITYTPNNGYAGTDSFAYNLTDAEGAQSQNATVTITIEATAPAISTGTISPGDLASNVGSTDGILTADDISVVDNGDSAEQGVARSCIGGCFDFNVSNITAGSAIQVILPLSEAIPVVTEGNTLLYRKLNTSTSTWSTFDTSGENAIHTAQGSINGSTTTCPAATDAAYDSSPSLTAGHACVRLTIVDGGPNDADSVANGTVVDPGGIAETFSIDTRVSGSDGCSMSTSSIKASDRADWWVVAGFLALLSIIRIHRRNS